MTRSFQNVRAISAASPAIACEVCEVRDRALCAALDRQEILALNAITTEVTLRPGQAVFHEDDEAHYVFNVTEGVVRLSKLLSDGRRQITGFLLPGDLVGIAMGERYAYSAEAIGAVRLCRFPTDRLRQLFERYQKLETRLLGIACDDLVAAQDHMVLLGRMTARERLLRFLVSLTQRMADRGGAPDRVHLPMVRADIADYLGLTVEHVSRTFRALADDGLIRLATATDIELANLDRIHREIEGV